MSSRRDTGRASLSKTCPFTAIRPSDLTQTCKTLCPPSPRVRCTPAPKEFCNWLLLIEFHIEIRPNRGGHRGSHFKSLDSCAGLARKSHPTNARLGGQSDRHVSGVADVLAGGASRRAEYWNLLRCRRSEEIGLGGPWDGAAWVTRCGGACQAGEPRALAAASRRAA